MRGSASRPSTNPSSLDAKGGGGEVERGGLGVSFHHVDSKWEAFLWATSLVVFRLVLNLVGIFMNHYLLSYYVRARPDRSFVMALKIKEFI